jgi:tetratricopeptide (TPR) repeat protein
MINLTLNLFFILIFSTISLAQNIPKLYKKVSPSIVKISSLDNNGLASSGTGFFIDQNTIITCYHVVDNIHKIDIRNITGQQFTVDSIIASNKQTDLIKFKVKEKSSTWLKLANKLPEVGQTVYLISNPNGFDFSISNGLISSIRNIDETQVIQTNASASPGSSGGPLIDVKGNVLGVISYVKYAGQNLNFAATSLNAINLINDRTITKLTAFPKPYATEQVDSIIVVAERLLLNRKYKKALDTILPVNQPLDNDRVIKITELIANCYFLDRDYSKAGQYFESLIHNLEETEPKTSKMVWSYAQAYHKEAVCHFSLGDKEGAVEILKKAEAVAKAGYEMDKERQELYSLQLQQIYVSDAIYKFALEQKFEACLSWKKAKKFGHETDDYKFEEICK